MPGAATILDLPYAVLIETLLRIPLEDRVCFVSTCTRLRHLGGSAAELWRGTVHLHIKQLQPAQRAALVAWLGGPGRYLHRLDVYLPAAPGLMFPVRLQLARSMLGSLTGGPEGSVELQVLRCCSGVPLDRCADSLVRLRRRLRRLEVHNSPTREPLHLPAQLGGLTALTSLHAPYVATSFSTGCLPTSLRTLNVALAGQGLRLPPVVTAATQLEALALSQGDSPLPGPINTAGLQHLTRLTYLALEFCQLPALPAQVALLPSLRALSVAGNVLSEEDLAEVLPTLPALRELDLCFCGLEWLPEQLFELTALEALSLCYNPGLIACPRDITRLRHRLAAFGCDYQVASGAASCTRLGQLTALTRLCVTDLPDDAEASHLAGVFRGLRGLPSLHVLGLNSGMPGAGGTWPEERSLAVAAPLLAAMPGLRVEAPEGLALPSELAAAEPWGTQQ